MKIVVIYMVDYRGGSPRGALTYLNLSTVNEVTSTALFLNTDYIIKEQVFFREVSFLGEK